jgi:UDP-4-amino-4,6-dideoxy-N-acetyl-beta-L-altrosamine transaminase
MKSIPYGRQSISDEDALAVIETLRSNWLTQGPAIERFERAVADYCGAQYAVAVSSATAALHIASIAAGVGPGRSLWTSPNTFVASANCARYCYGEVDFVDIDPLSLNMDVAKLQEKLEHAEQQGRLPQVIVPVDFSGQSCDMQAIYELAQHFGVTVLEDASHAIGGDYKETKVGSCKYADMTVFSFHPVKIVTTGEGGMILTNRHDLYEKLMRLRSHGITRKPELMQSATHGDWYYEQIELGFNYRMTDIQAALGVSQMKRIDEFVRRRREIAAEYDKALAGLPLTLPWRYPDAMSAWHLYVIQLNDPARRKTVFEQLRAADIQVNVHYIPVHTQPYYRKLGFKQGDFPVAEAYYQRAISLPMFPALQADEQAYVIETLGKVVN